MKFYSIFDDFEENSVKLLREAGMEVTVHPIGVLRPDDVQMKEILETYDGVIIGTSQKINKDMFENIFTQKIIATASVGIDHIQIPNEKRNLVRVLNTPKANAQSVAEYTVGCALACCKRLLEGRTLYKEGRNNKYLLQKPEDLCGKTLGVVGAGNISQCIMEYGQFIGMDVICWTPHPASHPDIAEKGIRFAAIDELLSVSDVISVNIPNSADTKDIISRNEVQKIKNKAIFISVSRKDTIDYLALFDRAKKNSDFYVCLDLDVSSEIVNAVPNIPNVLVTPHIAGGTVETRKRMFIELAEQIVEIGRL